MTDIVERLLKERNAAIREIGEWAARYGKAEAEADRLRDVLNSAVDVMERISEMNDIGDAVIAADAWLDECGYQWVSPARIALGDDQ